jgi:L-threonylcarbamoyladenylate synthase
MTGTPIVPTSRRDEIEAALADGGVVAIPTDTVYGLAARLDRPEAIASIFALKGRPGDVALPVLIGKYKQIHEIAAEWPDEVARLAARFWPGPLTVVVRALEGIGPLLGASDDTVGVRQPKHSLVRALCRDIGPLAVTSANQHGEPPCTTAQDVVDAFANTPAELRLVVDGGRCDGAPSTVLNGTVSPPVCLRDGAISWEWIEAARQMPQRKTIWDRAARRSTS